MSPDGNRLGSPDGVDGGTLGGGVPGGGGRLQVPRHHAHPARLAVPGAGCTIGRGIGAGGATVERVDAPPDDPEEWSDEQWQAYLQATADAEADLDAAGPADGATGFRKLKSSAAVISRTGLG